MIDKEFLSEPVRRFVRQVLSVAAVFSVAWAAVTYATPIVSPGAMAVHLNVGDFVFALVAATVIVGVYRACRLVL